MKNNQAILNCKTKTVIFKFKNENFTVYLTEGDLHDSWNVIATNDGKVFDFNFSWQNLCNPSVTLYAVDEENMTDFFNEYRVEIVSIIGTKADYFDLELDAHLDFTFILFSENGSKRMTTDSLNEISDKKRNTDYIICIDSNGATKTFC